MPSDVALLFLRSLSAFIFIAFIFILLQVNRPLADLLHTLDQIPDYIQQMLDHAKENVPATQRKTTNIYFWGTEG